MNKGIFNRNRNRKFKYTKKNKLNRNTKKNRKSVSLKNKKSKKNVHKNGGNKKKTSKKPELHIFQSIKKKKIKKGKRLEIKNNKICFYLIGKNLLHQSHIPLGKRKSMRR